MDDLVYIGITILFFAFTFGFVKLCEVLDTNRAGGAQ